MLLKTKDELTRLAGGMIGAGIIGLCVSDIRHGAQEVDTFIALAFGVGSVIFAIASALLAHRRS